MSAVEPSSQGFNFHGQKAQLIAARLDYVARHGAKFLFDNTPPPAPGWPHIVRGKVVTRLQRERA